MLGTLGVDTSKLDPVFLKFDDKRASQKKKYGGEFFPSSAKADGYSYLLLIIFKRIKIPDWQKALFVFIFQNERLGMSRDN